MKKKRKKEQLQAADQTSVKISLNLIQFNSVANEIRFSVKRLQNKTIPWHIPATMTTLKMKKISNTLQFT